MEEGTEEERTEGEDFVDEKGFDEEEEEEGE